jgi:hypothetical protein
MSSCLEGIGGVSPLKKLEGATEDRSENKCKKCTKRKFLYLAEQP